jgi:signal peptidase II
MISIILASLIAILDQYSKFIVSKNISLGQSIPVIANIFHLTVVHNRGAAFGILKNQAPLFILTALFVIAVILYNIKYYKENRFIFKLSLGLILGGAVSNLIDRITLGYVFDFLDLRIWPVFNVADSAITIGAILLGWYFFQKEAKN